jgi:hypothetical protein
MTLKDIGTLTFLYLLVLLVLHVIPINSGSITAPVQEGFKIRWDDLFYVIFYLPLPVLLFAGFFKPHD